MGRTEIGIRRTGHSTTIPDDPKAKLMYYLDCVLSCVDDSDDSDLRRLRDFRNYWHLTDEEEAKVVVLCLALSPDKLIGTVFILNEDLDCSNEFFELSAVSTNLLVSESLLVGGQRKRVQKIMMFKKCWIENNYLNPLQLYQEQWQRPVRPAPRPAITPTPRPAITPYTPRPTITPTPRPTITPTPRPAITPMPRPAITSYTPRPAILPTPRPAVTPTPRPAITPTPRPAITPTPRPAIIPTPRPVVTPTPKPAVKSTRKPTTQRHDSSCCTIL